jgi:hypothetical protein
MIRKSMRSGYDPDGVQRFSEKIMLDQKSEARYRFNESYRALVSSDEPASAERARAWIISPSAKAARVRPTDETAAPEIDLGRRRLI